MELKNIINNVEDQAEKQNVEEKNSIHREVDHLKDRQQRSCRKKRPTYNRTERIQRYQKTLSCPREGPEFESVENPLAIRKNEHRSMSRNTSKNLQLLLLLLSYTHMYISKYTGQYLTPIPDHGL